MEQSKKGHVIALAQADPFLTVKQLANQAGTTTRYVRTILSEAQLSLHEMRRTYAKRLGGSASAPKVTWDFPVYEELTITKVQGEQGAPEIADWTGLELFQASRMQKTSSPLCYEQLLTPQELTIRFEPGGLRELLPTPPRGRLEVGGQRVDICPAPPKLGLVLGLSESMQVVKLTTFLTRDDQPVALEIRWFGLEGVVLHWSKLQPELEVSLGS